MRTQASSPIVLIPRPKKPIGRPTTTSKLVKLENKVTSLEREISLLKKLFASTFAKQEASSSSSSIGEPSSSASSLEATSSASSLEAITGISLFSFLLSSCFFTYLF
jgi:hypothetical protein